MDRKQIATKLVLDKLEIPVALESFAERLAVQKGVYLAQAAGVDLGYHFRWYLKGPYSPALTANVFAVRDELRSGDQDESEGWCLNPQDESCLTDITPFLERDGYKQADWLELLASVHFLVKHSGVKPSPEALREVLEKNNKHFVESQIREALDHLSNSGVLGDGGRQL